MKEVIKAIKEYYKGTLQKTSDFENALKEIPKEDFVEFILEHQCRGCFRGTIHD